MQDVTTSTYSLCPYCLRRIAACHVVEGDSVLLRKSCPEHGPLQDTLVWENHVRTYSEWSRPEGENSAVPEIPDYCPSGCSTCRRHGQHTCSAIIEVTKNCNLNCPVCFADSGNGTTPNPTVSEISVMLRSFLDSSEPCPLQLSGGEPSLRDDLPEIIIEARKTGFDHIQLNTNGIRIASDKDYGKALKDAGLTNVFLQFDGISDDVYLRIRGTPLLETKLGAIARCAELKIGVILVPTIVRNVNEDQIGALIHFAKEWIPAVKGVHFQPMTYAGRYPAEPCNHDRIVIPDILAAIETQTGGELRVENMVPPG